MSFPRNFTGSPLHLHRGLQPKLGHLHSTIGSSHLPLGCVSDSKPKKRNGLNCFMVTVVVYLILLSTGAGLLVIKGEAALVPPGVTDTELQLSGEPWGCCCHLLEESSQSLSSWVEAKGGK